MRDKVGAGEMIASLQELCLNTLVDALTSKDYAFEFFESSTPEYFLQLVLSHAQLRHGTTGICDGVLSAAVGAQLSMLNLGDPDSISTITSCMLELAEPGMFCNIRSFVLNFSAISGAGSLPSTSLLAKSGGGRGHTGYRPACATTQEGFTPLVTQVELLMFAKVVLQGSRGVIEQLHLTGCTCLDDFFFRDIEPCGRGLRPGGGQWIWQNAGERCGECDIDGACNFSTNATESSPRGDTSYQSLEPYESGLRALALEFCDVADDVVSAVLVDAFRSMRHLERLSLRGCGNRIVVGQHQPQNQHNYDSRSVCGILGSDSQLAEILEVLLPAAHKTLQALDLSETNAGEETLATLLGKQVHRSRCPVAYDIAPNSNNSSTRQAPKKHLNDLAENTNTSASPRDNCNRNKAEVKMPALLAPRLKKLALDGCPGIDTSMVHCLVLESPRGEILEELSVARCSLMPSKVQGDTSKLFHGTRNQKTKRTHNPISRKRELRTPKSSSINMLTSEASVRGLFSALNESFTENEEDLSLPACAKIEAHSDVAEESMHEDSDNLNEKCSASGTSIAISKPRRSTHILGRLRRLDIIFPARDLQTDDETHGHVTNRLSSMSLKPALGLEGSDTFGFGNIAFGNVPGEISSHNDTSIGSIDRHNRRESRSDSVTSDGGYSDTSGKYAGPDFTAMDAAGRASAAAIEAELISFVEACDRGDELLLGKSGSNVDVGPGRITEVGRVYELSAELTGDERRLAHWLAERLGLGHESFKHRGKRRVRVTRPFPEAHFLIAGSPLNSPSRGRSRGSDDDKNLKPDESSFYVGGGSNKVDSVKMTRNNKREKKMPE